MFKSLARTLHLIIFFAIAMVGAWQFRTQGMLDEISAIVAFAAVIAITIEFCHLEVRRWHVSLFYLFAAITYAIVLWGAVLTVMQFLK